MAKIKSNASSGTVKALISTSTLDLLAPFCCFLLVTSVSVILCPFTKVEESFNLQAIHDILHLGVTNTSAYDHHEFPGVVPRSFIGPLLASLAPRLFSWMMTLVPPFAQLVLVRLCLGAVTCYCTARFAQSVGQIYGRPCLVAFTIITATQFHFLFYASRTLPNTFALTLALLAIGPILKAYADLTPRSNAALDGSVVAATISVFIFRAELLVFYAPLYLILFANKPSLILRCILIGLATAVVSIAASLGVDSYFWRRLLYPEAEVLYYNTIMNKSADWGTAPFAWYFYSALPRALAASYPLALVAGFIDKRLAKSLVPPVLFISAYSFLPHKELRFIIYTLPLFNVAAAVVSERWWRNKSKPGFLRKVLALVVVGQILANICLTASFAYCSSWNYPAGHALNWINQERDLKNSDVQLHIDVFSAQSGISRFLHVNNQWDYNKTEGLTNEELTTHFSHLLIGHPRNPVEVYRQNFSSTHRVAATVKGFRGLRISFDWGVFPYLKWPFDIEPQVLVLRRR